MYIVIDSEIVNPANFSVFFWNSSNKEILPKNYLGYSGDSFMNGQI